MPSLRLTDHEAEALTAFLMTHGEKKEDAGVETALKDPEQIKKGEALVRKYGCFGCHEIEGMDKESRIGVELTTFGSKHLDELFFGNQTNIPETWDQWTFHKLQTPRIYQTKDVEQLMPNFDFDDADINNLVVFLAGMTDGKVQERYRMPGSRASDANRRGPADGQLLQLRRLPYHRAIAAATSAASTQKIKSTSRRQYSMARASRFSPSGYSPSCRGRRRFVRG